MITPQTSDADLVRQLVTKVDSGEPLTPEALAATLETFESFECWEPYFRLITRNLRDPAVRSLLDYVRLARVQSLYLEDVFAAAETCTNLVKDLRISYRQLIQEVLPRVIRFEDYAAEAAILSAVSEKFAEKLDHVQCLERLCLLYEKKNHNEAQLGRTYERLLEVDPRNVKALRYFKLVFTQNNEWEEVVGILKTLLTCVDHPQELFRVAQELAAIYLYQLDMAQESIAVLETHCADSPLDTSTILYDAYQRLAHWTGCLKVLRQSLLTVDDDANRAIVHYKIAALHEQLSELEPALDHYQKAARHWPQCLDAFEGIINIAVLKQDWQLVQTTMTTLAERVQDERLIAQLRQAVRRLKDGVEHAKRSS